MTTEERDRRMAMLRAAQPYTSGRQRYALDLVLQANTLLSTARGGRQVIWKACETTARPEEMLMHMQEFCTPREADLVQMILNFIKAGHLFQNYRDFMAQQGPDENPDLHAAGFSLPICQSAPDAFAAHGRLWRCWKLQPSDGISDHTAFPGTTAAFRTAKELHTIIR